MTKQSKNKQCTFYVNGMHCASCEILIEKRLLEESGVKAADVSINRGNVNLIYTGDKPSIGKLNKIFKKMGYSFTSQKTQKKENPLFSVKNGVLVINSEKLNRYFGAMAIAMGLLIGFLLLENSNISSKISVNSSSSLLSFAGFGLLAGASSCAALVGGLLLSMTKKWQGHGSQPFVMFNTGRLISFTILGGLLGAFGGLLGISLENSPAVTAVLIIFISLMMVILGLQMLQVQWASKFQLKMPKTISRFAGNENNFNGKSAPFIVGALTFFLPCGFTLVAQSLALTSGSFIKGASMMLFFALGTLPMLALISFSSVSLSSKPKLSRSFNLVAGILVLFFALYNFNAQLNVLGFSSLSDIKFTRSEASENVGDFKGLPTTTNSKGEVMQILRTTAGSFGYKPSVVFVEAGKPIKWEIDDIGTSGCTGGIISRDLFGSKSIRLSRGINTVELPALEKGTYKYSCWMGMYSGTIKAI